MGGAARAHQATPGILVPSRPGCATPGGAEIPIAGEPMRCDRALMSLRVMDLAALLYWMEYVGLLVPLRQIWSSWTGPD